MSPFDQLAYPAIDFNAGIGLVQMMGKSNILGVVGGGKQPKFANSKVSKQGLLGGFLLFTDICVAHTVG